MNKAQESANKRYLEIIDALNKAAPKSATGRRDFSEVTKSTGLKSSWLSQFVDSGIGDAGYKRIFVLSSYLFENGLLKEVCTDYADAA